MTPHEWIIGNDTGISSKTIWAVMMGAVSAGGWFGVPQDPDDFGRCYRLLKLFPEWKDRLHEVTEYFPAWTGLVREWDRLTELYEKEVPSGRCPELYAAMNPLIDEGMVADGWKQTGPGSWTKSSNKTQEEPQP